MAAIARQPLLNQPNRNSNLLVVNTRQHPPSAHPLTPTHAPRPSSSSAAAAPSCGRAAPTGRRRSRSATARSRCSTSSRADGAAGGCFGWLAGWLLMHGARPS